MVTRRSYIPDRGDLVWLQFDPQAGREQAGQRPALVLSPQSYNQVVGLALLCPITSHVKHYPFEVSLSQSGTIQGVVLADHVKSLDWKVRKASFAGRVPAEKTEEVLAKLRTLL